jgi:hypothetical protein
MFMLVQFFIPAWTSAYETVVDWTQTIYIFTLLVGVVGMVKYHLDKVSRKEKDYFYNIVTLIGVAAMAIAGLAWGREEGTAFSWMFDYMQAPMQATVFSLLAFFVASAAYRGLKIRNFLGSLLFFCDDRQGTARRLYIILFSEAGQLDTQCSLDDRSSRHLRWYRAGYNRYLTESDTGS